MTGPVVDGERADRISWASRPGGSTSVPGRLGSNPPEAIEEEDEPHHTFLSPGEGRMVGESPAAVTPAQAAGLKLAMPLSPAVVHQFDGDFSSAPPELYQPHRRITGPGPLRLPETFPESWGRLARGCRCPR